MNTEICRGCNGPAQVNAEEDVALCDLHWNEFLWRYAGGTPPCGAHLIKATK